MPFGDSSGCPGLFCHSSTISNDSEDRRHERHVLPLKIIIAVLLDESFYTGVRLNEQTTMWECVVNYQDHRCLQEMLVPNNDRHNGYSRLLSYSTTLFSVYSVIDLPVTEMNAVALVPDYSPVTASQDLGHQWQCTL